MARFMSICAFADAPPPLLPQIAPTADRVLVKIAEAETTTAGGIILAESAQRKPTSGTSEPPSLDRRSS